VAADSPSDGHELALGAYVPSARRTSTSTVPAIVAGG